MCFWWTVHIINPLLTLKKAVSFLKLPELGADAISKYLSDIILNFEDLKKVSKDFVGFEDFIPGSLRQATQYHKTIQKEKLEEFTETANELEGKYYIRFGKFLTDFLIEGYVEKVIIVNNEFVEVFIKSSKLQKEKHQKL